MFEINYDPDDTTFPDPGTVSIELEKTVGEGDGVVTLIVSRTGAAQDCEVVGVRTYFGYGGYEATPGLDYTALSTIVQFGDGDTANKQVTIPIIDDALGERDETFAVEISPANGFGGQLYRHGDDSRQRRRLCRHHRDLRRL